MLVAGRADKEKTQGKDEVEIFTEVPTFLRSIVSRYSKNCGFRYTLFIKVRLFSAVTAEVRKLLYLLI